MHRMRPGGKSTKEVPARHPRVQLVVWLMQRLSQSPLGFVGGFEGYVLGAYGRCCLALEMSTSTADGMLSQSYLIHPPGTSLHSTNLLCSELELGPWSNQDMHIHPELPAI